MMRRWLATLCATLLLAAPALGQTRGYIARDVGFSATLGGAAICDGGATNPDLDGNGTADRETYVDCSGGTNNTTCGAPASPCASIQWALDGSNSSFTDRIRTPDANQIQAVCFKGICGNAALTLTQSGAAGTPITVAQTGSDARAFNYPRFPFILSGWDADGDGRYYPADTDASDVAELDGNVSGDTGLAIANSASLSRIQLAHFGIRDYGLACGNDNGAMKMTGSSGSPTQLFLHDLKLVNVLRDCGNGSTLITFNFFNQSAILTSAAIENSEIDGFGSYLIRGTGNNGSGLYRFKNITAKAHGADGDAVAGLKLWNETTGVEILDSVFDANVAAWTPLASGGAPTQGLVPAQCLQDVVIRNTLVKDFKQGINIQPYAGGAGFCESRALTGVVIDRAEILNTYGPWQFGDHGIEIGGGLNSTARVGDVTISSSFLSSLTGWEAALRLSATYDGSCGATGTIRVLGNTMAGELTNYAAINIGDPQFGDGDCSGYTYDVRDNLILSAPALCTTIVPSPWTSNYNVFPTGSQFKWNSAPGTCTSSLVSLGTWQTSSGGDANSVQCAPSVVNAAIGNWHLNDADTCAKNAGVDISALVPLDFDGHTRGAGGFDIGADEIPAAAAPGSVRRGVTGGGVLWQ